MAKNKVISLDEMKQIELNILKQFALFCDKHNLQYSLCGGTLLGAVRHKGFIPWDDDIDVFVTRKSYEFLRKHFNSWGKKYHLKLINYYCHHYYSTFAKIIDTRTTAIEEKRNEKIGVWIDLFIIDSMKRNDVEFSKPIIEPLKGIRHLGSDDYFSKSKSIKAKLINFKKMIVRFYRKKIYRKQIENFIQMNQGSYNVAYSFADQIPWWESSNQLDFSNPIEINFEGFKFKVISNWKEYLINRYGQDFLTPPPPHKREKHELTRCSWRFKKNTKY